MIWKHHEDPQTERGRLVLLAENEIKARDYGGKEKEH